MYMTKVFRIDPPYEIFLELLNYCNDMRQYFICNYECYRKIIFHNQYREILDRLREYYYTSKQFYVDRRFDYNSFVVIMRQLCRAFNKDYSWKAKSTLGKIFLEYKIYV